MNWFVIIMNKLFECATSEGEIKHVRDYQTEVRESKSTASTNLGKREVSGLRVVPLACSLERDRRSTSRAKWPREILGARSVRKEDSPQDFARPFFPRVLFNV